MKKFCIIYLILLFTVTLFPKLITDFSYHDQNASQLLHSPSFTHLFGTDELGRDLLTRILYGARISLACALLATLIAGFFGVLIGSISGFYGGKVDVFLMRIIDILYSIPDLLFYILIGLFLGRSFSGLLIALSILSWINIARLIRGEVLKHKEAPFVEGAYALGAHPVSILIKHILPQTLNILIVSLIFKIPSIILAESTLSFIGLGLKPPFASWGTLASEGYQAIQFYPHLIFFPSLFIFLTIFSFQVIGKELNQKKINR